jgi:hypothetical protein
MIQLLFIVLSPDIMAPATLGGVILSPYALSPALVTESVLMADVLSPSFFSRKRRKRMMHTINDTNQFDSY